MPLRCVRVAGWEKLRGKTALLCEGAPSHRTVRLGLAQLEGRRAVTPCGTKAWGTHEGEKECLLGRQCVRGEGNRTNGVEEGPSSCLRAPPRACVGRVEWGVSGREDGEGRGMRGERLCVCVCAGGETYSSPAPSLRKTMVGYPFTSRASATSSALVPSTVARIRGGGAVVAREGEDGDGGERERSREENS